MRVPGGAAAWILLLAGLGTPGAQALDPDPGARSATRLRFTLDNEYATSAGVYDADGRLLKTLWSNVRRPAGAHEMLWDGTDDAGQPVGSPRVEFRVLAHNVVYRWDGVIGNSTPSPIAPDHHDGQYFLSGLAIAGDRAFFSVQNEGRVPNMRYFATRTPQTWAPFPGLANAVNAILGAVATDGHSVYWAHDASPWSWTWGKGGDRAFVTATDVDLATERRFAAGRPLCSWSAGTGCVHNAIQDYGFDSVIDEVAQVAEDPRTKVLESARNNVTGMAVEQEGDRLYVAHGGLAPGRLHLLDKHTGGLIAAPELPGVGGLTCAAGRLYAIHEPVAGRRVVSEVAVGGAPDYRLSIVRTLDGLVAPLAVALRSDGRELLVADGGASQQVKAFDPATGRPLWQLGAPGGYAAHGPRVTTDKFWFTVRERDAALRERTVLAYAPDGSFWIGDPGPGRLLHYAPDRRYLEQIAFTPIEYNVAVDRTDPARVFASYREYHVDYRQPAATGWRLVNYYGATPVAASAYHDFAPGFVDVTTLADGRTMALLRADRSELPVELKAPDGMTVRGEPLLIATYLEPNGDAYGVDRGATGATRFWRRPLENSGVGDSWSWGDARTVARVAATPADPRMNLDYYPFVSRPVALVGEGDFVLFDPQNPDPGHTVRYHLAGVRPGAANWWWRTSRDDGPFNFAGADGTFDSSQPWYAAMAVTGLGDDLVYNYHGEGWGPARGQANQFLHWRRDGLFVGQFGVPVQQGTIPGTAGAAGNSLSLQLVDAGGRRYLWHNDEHFHGGVHRWQLDGIERVREWSGAGPVGGVITVDRLLTPLPPAPPAPQGLEVHDVAGGGVDGVAGADQLLLWRLPPGSPATDIEIQRLDPGVTGARFRTLAQVPAGRTWYLDRQPLAGVPTVYRVRAVAADGAASDYSAHVAVTARSEPMLLQATSFAPPPPGLYDNTHRSEQPGNRLEIMADPDDPAGRVLHLRQRRPEGSDDYSTEVRIRANDALTGAVEQSLSGPVGGAPALYRLEFRLRVREARLSPGSAIGAGFDPGFPLFSTSGRGYVLSESPEWRAAVADRRTHRVAVTIPVFPTGQLRTPLSGYRPGPSPELAIGFPATFAAAGDLMDVELGDLRVVRLDPARNPGVAHGDDATAVEVPDPALAARLHETLGVASSVALSRGDLRRLRWLDLHGRGIHSLAGLQWAQNLLAVDVCANPLGTPDNGPLRAVRAACAAGPRKPQPARRTAPEERPRGEHR